jgi:exopolysaccharide biosynthesis polyprenyl glycosylphosphotransferase
MTNKLLLPEPKPDIRMQISAFPHSYAVTIQFMIKRSIDFLCAGLGCLLLSPLLVVTAILIRLDSSGPIFFRQERMGLGGRVFRIWKFRTMCTDAELRLSKLEELNESADGLLFKMKTDPRVTKLGHFLRRTSIDELPQLFNVLQGQMSLIGPRPLQLRDWKLILEAIGEPAKHRLAVLPGITGLWQVSGRSDLGFDQMLQLDNEYINNWSLLRDLLILMKTVIIVLAKKGAY